VNRKAQGGESVREEETMIEKEGNLEEGEIPTDISATVDVEPRVEKPKVASKSAEEEYYIGECLLDNVIDPEMNVVVDDGQHLAASQRSNTLIIDLCDVFDEVGYDDMIDAMMKEIPTVPQPVPDQPAQTLPLTIMGDIPLPRRWERWTRVFEPFLEESEKKKSLHTGFDH